MRPVHILLLVGVFCWDRSSAQATNLNEAYDIKLSSINFKTLMDWKPKPTNYTYTVMVRGGSSDWTKKCINTKETTCDVTDLLKDTRAKYDVRIYTNIKPSDSEEFPYVEGPTFIPYNETIIGKPKIQNFTFNKEHNRLTVLISDTPTPYRYSNNTVMTLRDIFQNDFVCTMFYRKAGSTGKKSQSSSTNEIVLNVEKDESYCFYVQASVPSRSQNRMSQNSDEVCTPSNGGEFDITILVAVGVAVALIVLIVVLSVVLCKCRSGKKENAKETERLNDV